ncbi:hypothetical protein FNO01nite_29340 [Flavobacterium noncentrifugens]|uniref:Uncharacterized protein n=1 Tax=Flavobacterium noncentrifugens TaxID=1128970 RepID=A0A1G8Y0K4_9FLAO|nr:hypothetical protein [Flavobacterium noncentrifugens]GEP52262.1 hypothetical protein FNO01nite_29340 [Flavobacterium noncentrifugens]SDJ96257.1 hypothetical protein SAMN04487935_2140 [Flavobacterium noncentrifugens]
MKITPTVEVKCDCKIPFQSELEHHLEQLISRPENPSNFQTAANLKSLAAVLHHRLIFIKVTHPIKDMRPRLLKKVKQLLNKDLVGTIKGTKNEITLILL